MKMLPGALLACLAAALLSAPALAQDYTNGGPQPGSEGIGVMPLPAPGKPPSSDGIVIGQQTQTQTQTQTGQAQTGQAQTGQTQIGDAIAQATAQAEAQGGGQGNGQATAPAGQGAVQNNGQGGFVADNTGLGNTTDSSTPPSQPVNTGPRTEVRKVTQGSGAVLRWLDKVSGRTEDISLSKGQSKTAGRLTITLGQCRYPVDDPSSNAYAFVTIHDSLVKDPIFKGWMIAASPALDPLESPRYDVWLLNCTTS